LLTIENILVVCGCRNALLKHEGVALSHVIHAQAVDEGREEAVDVEHALHDLGHDLVLFVHFRQVLDVERDELVRAER